MARLVHRRPAARRRPPQPRGLAGLAACISGIGWLSLLATAATFWLGIRPIVDAGPIDQQSAAALLLQLGMAIGSAALLAMPVALEVGSPGIARRNPWLWRGAVLIAAAEIARPILSAIQGFVVGALDPAAAGQQLDPRTPLGLAFAVAGFGLGIISISGVWAFSDGLADAGARLPRPVLVLVPLAVVGATVAAYWPALTANIDLSTVVGWLNVVGFGLSMVLIGLYVAMALRLVAGLVLRLVPVPAWVAAGLAGVALLVYRVATPAVIVMAAGPQVAIAFRILFMVIWPLLVAAALLGLGRGRRERRVPSRVMRLYVVNPTA